jgi:CheW-like protein
LNAGAYVGFLLGGVRLAVEAARVRGIARVQGIIAVPFTRTCVQGVIVQDGRLVPVLDLARVPSLWNELPEGGGEQVIVLGAGEVEAGLLGSGAEAFTFSPTSDPGGREPVRPPACMREAILCGALSASGRTYGILKIEAALAAAGVPAA